MINNTEFHKVIIIRPYAFWKKDSIEKLHMKK